jgi:uncharacterized protein (TIGR03435 family)
LIRRCILGMSLLLLALGAAAQKPSFEIVSIKLNTSGRGGGGIGPRGDSLLVTNVTLKGIVMYAYAPPGGAFLNAQIFGGPSWNDTDHFDIIAKPAGNAKVVPGEQTKTMLQSLLEDRFQLKVHRETRNLPVYNLVVFKNGPKLSEDQTPPDTSNLFTNYASPGEPLDPLPRGALRIVSGATTSSTGTAISIPRILTLLQHKSDRIIVDKTGFKGLVDIHLEYIQDLGEAAPDAVATNQSTPSLSAALGEIGLKLESAKAPTEVLVIDSAQKPSEN